VTAAKLFLFALIYCVLTGALAPSANAGTYTVSSCHFRDGSPAPTDLWRVAVPSPGVIYDLSCAEGSGGSGLGAGTSGANAFAPGFATGLEIRAPSPLVITEASVQDRRWSPVGSGWALLSGYYGRRVGQEDWTPLDVCNWCDGVPRDWHIIYSGAGVQSFGPAVSCSEYGTTCPKGSIARTAATGVELTVADPSAPTFKSAPTGTLLDPRSSATRRTLQYVVADRGSGVEGAALVVDGRAVASSRFDSVVATCVPPYATFVPCPPEVSDAFTVDTSRFTPGPHHGQLVVRDASGAALDYNFQFMAPGPPQAATGCAAGAPLPVRLSHRHARYGARSVSFTVRRPATDHSEVLVMEEVGGAFLPLGTATRKGSKYTAHFRVRTRKTLRFVAPLSGGAAYQCSRAIPLRVRAGLHLIVNPRSVANGETIRFRGRLFGGPAAVGRIVELQARARGGRRTWTLVRTLRTRRAGQFRMSYTFQRTSQRVVFEFRAIRKASDDFPYESGASNIRTVLVRG
jgi:hypothetical protein